MKRRWMAIVAGCLCASLAWAAEEKPTLPLPNTGSVTLTLDEYNRLMELAAKPPKKPDVAPLPYSIKHAAVKAAGRECGNPRHGGTGRRSLPQGDQ